jgi:hypothetical protein
MATRNCSLRRAIRSFKRDRDCTRRLTLCRSPSRRARAMRSS